MMPLGEYLEQRLLADYERATEWNIRLWTSVTRTMEDWANGAPYLAEVSVLMKQGKKAEAQRVILQYLKEQFT